MQICMYFSTTTLHCILIHIFCSIRLFRHLKTLNFQLIHLICVSNILKMLTVIRKLTYLSMEKRRTLTKNFLTKRRAKSFQFHSMAHSWKSKKMNKNYSLKERTAHNFDPLFNIKNYSDSRNLTFLINVL